MTARRLLVLAPLVAAGSLAAQDTSRYSLKGSDLAVYNLVGAVQLEAGTGDAVTVDVTRGGADASRLRVDLAEQHGRSSLRVLFPGDRIRYPKMGKDGSTTLQVSEDGTFDDDEHHGRRVRISAASGDVEAWADLRIAVPAGRKLALHLGVGRVSVTNVDGQLRLQTACAPVTVKGGRGELRVDVGAGDVDVTDMNGELRIETGSGGVDLTRAHGRGLSIETGSGDVTVAGAEAEELTVTTGSGDIRVSAAKAPRVGLETGSGAVTLELQAEVTRLDVETGSGDVAITAPPTLSAELEIETGSGDIDTDFPLAVTRSARDHLRGTVGSGKGKISVETGSGGVRLVRAHS